MTTTPNQITLSKNAPWAASDPILRTKNALRNCYRERFCQVGERYFKISAEYLDSPWWIEEITREGEVIFDTETGHQFGKWAFRLSEARQIIYEETS